MKKISLFALALITSVALFAQDNVNRTAMAVKPYFGIKGGVNLAKLRASDFPMNQPSTNLKTTAHVGVLMHIPLTTTGGFAVQPELLYNRYGSKMNVRTTVGSVTTSNAYEQDMGYVSLPIMLQWKSMGGFYVEAGPQPSFLIHAQQEGAGTNNETENKDYFDKFDISVGGGLGYMSRMGLGIGARYVHGLSNTIEDGGGNNSPNDGAELKHQVVSIGLVWLFGANK